MKLLNLTLENFGSYKSLNFDLDNKGLSLVYGKTGAGKSTLQDGVFWVLFGSTSKGVNSNDIRSWNEEADTIGILTVSLRDATIQIVRTRGKVNDLYWIEDARIVRGKNLVETQGFLENHLNISEELYATAACYNEFSLTSNFFTSSAKDRRELIDKITDLEFANKLEEGLKDQKREVKKQLAEKEKLAAKYQGKLDQLKSSFESIKRSHTKWTADHANELLKLETCSLNFEKEKESKVAAARTKYETHESKTSKIFKEEEQKLFAWVSELEALGPDKCNTCGRSDEKAVVLKEKIRYSKDKIKETKKLMNPYLDLVSQASVAENTYRDQLTKEQSRHNPFEHQLDKFTQELEDAEKELIPVNSDLGDLKYKYAALEQLQALNLVFRGELTRKTLKVVQDQINRYLDTYFDSEIKIEMSIVESDDIELEIQKSGNFCSFKQLSRGQRSILRLCFAVSIASAAANKAGVHFDCLMFDEVTDGLDADLKVKAFNLFSELAIRHSSVFLIDHATELQNLFENKYYVEMQGDSSVIQYN